MHQFLVIVGGVLLLWVLGRSTTQAVYKDGQTPMTLNELYKKYGKKYNIEPELIKAIAQAESGEDVYAINPNDPSYGVMQILFTGSNTFNIEGWPEVLLYGKSYLMEPSVNIKMGAQILAWNVSQYGKWKGVAVYNRWASRMEEEPFTNQAYVNRVKDNYQRIMLRGGL
jgi:soluble lytic murein transglycosylase-like protein